MSLLLAQVAPTGVSAWLESFFWLVGGIGGLIFLYRQARGLPQPMQVQAAHGVATQQDVKEVHGRISRERQEIDRELSTVRERVDNLEHEQGDSLEKLRLEMKGDIKGVHDRINEVLSAVSHLRGRVER